jgi:hypothetical protein
MAAYTLPDMPMPDDWWEPIGRIRNQDGSLTLLFSNGMKLRTETKDFQRAINDPIACALADAAAGHR